MRYAACNAAATAGYPYPVTPVLPGPSYRVEVVGGVERERDPRTTQVIQERPVTPRLLFTLERTPQGTNRRERFFRELRRGTKVRDHKFPKEEAEYALLYLEHETLRLAKYGLPIREAGEHLRLQEGNPLLSEELLGPGEQKAHQGVAEPG